MKSGGILLSLALPLVAAGGLFAQSPQLPTDSLTFYYTEGVRLSAEMQPEGSLEMFERALALDADHTPALYEAAISAMTAGRGEKVLPYALRAAELDKENIWYQELAAHSLVSAGRLDEAIEIYRTITGAGKRFNPDNYRMLAILYAQKGDMDEAMATLDSVQLLVGSTPGIIELKRGILIEAGRMEDAVRETESYVAVTPYDEENRLVLAEMYVMEGCDSLAMKVLHEVLAVNPDNAEALRMLAPAPPPDEDPEKLLARGDIEGALAALKRRIGHSSGNVSPADTPESRVKPSLETYDMIVEIEAYLTRMDSVVLYSRRAIEAYPRETRFYLFKSMAEQLSGRLGDARQTLSAASKVVRTDSLHSEIWGATGNLSHEEGNDKKAFAAYRKALRYNPNNTLVLNNYAYYLATADGNNGDGGTAEKPAEKDLARALKMVTKATALEPDNATYLDTYAWILYLSGDYAGARKVMSQALPLDRRNNPELLMHYGDILWALGEEFMASVYWKRARDSGYKPATEIEERLSRKK